MPWPPETAPEDKLHEALYTLEEIRGDEQAIAFLQQELARLRVVTALRSQRQKLLPAPASAPKQLADGMAAAIEVVAEALSFYGEETYYERPKTGRDRQSVIDKDGGDKALKALAVLADAQEAEGGE